MNPKYLLVKQGLITTCDVIMLTDRGRSFSVIDRDMGPTALVAWSPMLCYNLATLVLF